MFLEKKYVSIVVVFEVSLAPGDLFDELLVQCGTPPGWSFPFVVFPDQKEAAWLALPRITWLCGRAWRCPSQWRVSL